MLEILLLCKIIIFASIVVIFHPFESPIDFSKEFLFDIEADVVDDDLSLSFKAERAKRSATHTARLQFSKFFV